jgi:hypothetical protein
MFNRFTIASIKDDGVQIFWNSDGSMLAAGINLMYPSRAHFMCASGSSADMAIDELLSICKVAIRGGIIPHERCCCGTAVKVMTPLSYPLMNELHPANCRYITDTEFPPDDRSGWAGIQVRRCQLCQELYTIIIGGNSMMRGEKTDSRNVITISWGANHERISLSMLEPPKRSIVKLRTRFLVLDDKPYSFAELKGQLDNVRIVDLQPAA